MDRLSALPEELICEIIRLVVHGSLPALASVSHEFHRLIIPRLYGCVNLDGSDSNSVDRGSHSCANYYKTILSARRHWPLYPPSRMLRLKPFHETVVKCPHVRSHITIASFDLHDNRFEATIGIISDIIDLPLPSLQTLDISPGFYRFNTQTDTVLKSLKIPHDFSSQGNHVKMTLVSLFRIPTLRNLCIEKVARRDTFLLPHCPQHPARSRTSNVTSLSFPTGVSLGDDLAEILFVAI